MVDRRAAWSLPLALAVIALGTWSVSARESPAVHEVPTELTPSVIPVTPGTRWIVAGGGPSPELNQVQIEQDLALAQRTLEATGRGMLLYSGGPNTASVQVLRSGAGGDPLMARLGELFDPRGGRDSTYRASGLAPVGAATAEAIVESLRGAINDGSAPLTVYLAGHGIGGEEPHESRFLTWGPGELEVDALAEVLDGAGEHRPVRMVVTACYAGGFAELAFRAADPEQGAAPSDRCGFFATTWDRAAAGCDPNPDRAAQEGYGLHFLHALAGEDRDGGEMRAAIDLDGDGVVSLVEAHAWARVASSSLDVPVTTSERFLRAAAPDTDLPDAALPPAHLPVERAVIDALAMRLDLDAPADVYGRIDAVQARLQPLVDELDRLEEDLGFAQETFASELLHRWPVLDDPWHPEFASTIATDRDAIEAHFESSGAAQRVEALSQEREQVALAHDELLVEAAPMERLERALETLGLAARLQAEGGSYWLRYLRFLACEAGRP